METQNARLDFFSKYLEIQKGYVLNSYEQSANFAFAQLKRDETIKELLLSLENTDSVNFNTINQKLISYTSPLFNDLKTSGFSLMQFTVKKPSFQQFHEKPCNHGISTSNNNYNFSSDTSHMHSYNGFSFDNEFVGYKFIYPYIENSKHLGCFEFGFNYHLIKMHVNETNDNTETGFVVWLNDSTNIDKLIKSKEFVTAPFSDKLLIEHDFPVPVELKSDKKIQTQLKTHFLNSSINNNAPSFSIFLNSKKNASAITFTRLFTLNNFGNAYLVSINNDHMLAKAKELNNAILIINLIIIILAMIGFSYLVINRLNILEQKRNIQASENNLKELNQSKDKFFTIVAHDLKNPFNGIMGLSGYLYNEFENVEDEEKREIINDINIASKNAFNLLQNLLEWTRAQSGLIRNVPVIIEPKNIISLSLETVTNLAKNKDIIIKETYLTEAKGYADENLVSTVIRNLTTNAIKFSPRNSTVEIIVNYHNNELYFCVKDKGIGLSDKDIDKLFRIDVNFHKRGTEKETGSGFGLKLCKEFIEYCGGRIWVVSEFGKGSSFFFTIPILMKS